MLPEPEEKENSYQEESSRSIWQVCREYASLADATGVKSVSRGLAESAAKAGWRSSVILPYYGFLTGKIRTLKKIVDLEFLLLDKLEKVTVWCYQLEGVSIYLLENHYVGEKQGVYTYVDEVDHITGQMHVDNEEINMMLQKSALELGKVLGAPDIIHVHDGHTALLPVLAREDKQYQDFYCKTKFVLTLHNLGIGWHQEISGMLKAQAITELSTTVLKKGIISGDTIDPLALAAHYCKITTVSPEFAEEIFSPENEILMGYIGDYYRDNKISITGIYNGIDFEKLDPREPHLPYFTLPFDPGDQRSRIKSIYKDSLVCFSQDGDVGMEKLEKYGYLDHSPEMVLYAVQSRIIYEKGIDYLCDALKIVFEQNSSVCIAVMGDGDLGLEYKLIALTKNPAFFGRFVFWRGYSQRILYPLIAGSDFFIMPSVYEPCGLADLYAQIYGSLPIVHYTGGLKKVINMETGFIFHTLDAKKLAKTILSAVDIYTQDPERIIAMRKNAFERVQEYFTWDVIFSQHYEPFYKEYLNEDAACSL